MQIQLKTTRVLAAGVALICSLLPNAVMAVDAPSAGAPLTGAQSISATPLGAFPLFFEPNQGQVDERVQFLSRGPGHTLFLMPSEAILWLRQKATKGGDNGESTAGAETANATAGLADGTSLRMRMVGGNEVSSIAGLRMLPGKSNYLVGSEPSAWRTGISHFASVRYANIYPGIDLVFHGDQGELEYDFVVSAGANPEAIELEFTGADHLVIDPAGDLVLQVDGATVRQRKPFAYQLVANKRAEISSNFVLKGNGRIGFEVAGYDVRRPLIIDPILIFSTYLGGSTGSSRFPGIDEAIGRTALDTDGNIYLTGETFSSDFPTSSPFQASNAGQQDIFVSKLSSDGATLLYSTYIGGSADDRGQGIAVDNDGQIYVVGRTKSGDFLTMNPFQASNAGGPFDGFVLKLNVAGSALVYSSYIGGGGLEDPTYIDVDASGSAYIVGETRSGDFPTQNPFQASNAGGVSDCFVTKFDPSGTSLVYSTYLGGTGTDLCRGLALDNSGSAYLTGNTDSNDFPTLNPIQGSNAGGRFDAFITKLVPSGAALAYSSYLGGGDEDVGLGAAVGASGNAFVSGSTSSSNFPTANALQPSNAGDADAFVAKVDPAGTALTFSTYLGGTGEDRGARIALDSAGSAYVTGVTASADFPTVDPIQASNAGGTFDIFVAKLDGTGSGLVYSTYFGGSDIDQGSGIAVDQRGDAYITGQTDSADFPTESPFQANLAGPRDAFVAKIGQLPIDHYLLYDVNVTRGSRRFARRTVTLTDQFDEDGSPRSFHVRSVGELGNPAEKEFDGEVEPIVEPDSHLVAYRIRRARGEPGHIRLSGVKVTNQFGEIVLDTRAPDRLLVPSLKDLANPIPSSDLPDQFPVDHFKCYPVSITKDTERFVPRDVLLDDQFEATPLMLRVRRPFWLCNPARKTVDGEAVTPITRPGDHLLCYALGAAKSQGDDDDYGAKRRVRVRVKRIHVNNQFGALQLDAKRIKALCVPSTKDLGGAKPR